MQVWGLWLEHHLAGVHYLMADPDSGDNLQGTRFRLFTKESLVKIEQRIQAEQEEKEAREATKDAAGHERYKTFSIILYY